ncbi:leishmanolysin family protein (macronuclear) [Tetrahymena thermophila SB210]|uniref:Leishmanolysin family protein n=1 Tax=Tetrahymena thermophila (strain SB210) TaxID=312017 RepID=I7M9X6_TETTS|nr:leishmanolysin family protein [Tetrahymena thermophila SB210]EAS03002.1 leishmanolysin family protein [Tetrahymena thermophila SB210]|eukprot:XP_001023247.1 leishmanolysin family protein [Tetrahymena thermophila SB210]
MRKENIKRISSIAGLLILFVVIIAIYNENAEDELTRGVNFFKKHSFSFNDSSIHKHIHKYDHECGHNKIIEQEKLLDQPKQAFDESLFEVDDISKVLPIEKDFKNIRISMDYSNVASQPASVQTFLKTQVVPPIMNHLQEMIKVQRLTAPIKVDPYYKLKNCGQANIKIPAEHISVGVSNTDLIFYVQAYRDSSNLLAYASYCPQSEPYGLASGRPTVAYMNINLNQLDKDLASKDPMSLAKWIFILTHEVVHSLVFSPNYFDKFLGEKNPVKTFDGKSYVVAPSIVKLAQDHFGCPTLNKVPLEDEGGPATFGTHWERKAFGNELMTGSQLYDSVFSKFTAAMFTASGWYQVVDYMTATLTWGVGEKCEFVEYSCPKSSKEFCSVKGSACSYDYVSPGTCSDSDFLADKCTYWQGYSNQHCNFPDENTKKVYQTSGGAWGAKSRCFNTNVADSARWVGVKSLCFESYCDYSGSTTKVVFKVFNKEYTCTATTKQVTIPGKGVVDCPDVLRFCFSPSACPYSCSGKGVCRLGKCSCYKGFKGEDCSQLA